MKKTMTWMFVGVLSLGYALMAQASDMNGAAEKAVTALEQKWMEAQRDNKSELEAPLLADKYVLIDQNGNILDRTQMLAAEKATKYTAASLEDIKVTVFGDTAIARTLNKYKGTDPKGQPLDSNARWTDTWVKMPDGKWQCVASHGSNVKKQ